MKYETKFNIVMIFFMALSLSLTMSLAMVLVHVGFVDNLISLWMDDFIIGFIVAFPVSLAVLPVIIKATKLIVKEDEHPNWGTGEK